VWYVTFTVASLQLDLSPLFLKDGIHWVGRRSMMVTPNTKCSPIPSLATALVLPKFVTELDQSVDGIDKK